MPSNHLINALSEISRSEPDRVFATTPDRTVTLGEFFDGAENIATALVQAQVAPGDRVTAQVGKSLEALQLYIGTVMAGGIFVPLNPAYTPREIEYFLNDASPTVFVCDPKDRAKLEASCHSAKVHSHLTLASNGTGSLMNAAKLHTAGFEPLARGAEDLAAILYTSGTTGKPKGAMLSHRALVTNGEILVQQWQFSKADVLIHALPVFHTHGLFVATNVALMSGCKIRFHTDFDTSRIIDDMADATVLMGVPTHYVRLLNNPKLSRENTANMRLFISGSAPLLAATHAHWQTATGHRILERYGMTETNMNTSNPIDGERRPGTVGFPLPGIELKICDPVSGRQLDQGQIGSIEVRGPNLFSGYWNMPEKTKEDMRGNGFLITGDLGSIDADGYVNIVGRSKDMIISGGLNVYPKEIELLIDLIDGVDESAVFGVPHADFGQAVVAAIVAKGEPKVGPGDVAEFLQTRLAGFKRPKHVEFVGALPRNAMGKVQKNQLAKQYRHLFDG